MESQGGFLISQIKHISGRVWEKLFSFHGMGDFNGAQGTLLYVLWQEDGISSAELARRSGLAPTTLTSMLDRLERQGLIQRVPHESDRRRLKLVLTERAKSLQKQSESYSQEMTDIYYQGFSEEEIIAFEDTLRRVLENLQICEKNGFHSPKNRKDESSE